MNIIKSKASIFIASLLLSTTVSAQSPKQAAINDYKIMNGHFDTRLNAKVFNWNNSRVKNIPLNNYQQLDAQYIDGFNQYFEKTAALHGANKLSIAQASIGRFHDTGKGGLIAQFPQTFDDIEVFGRSINILINRKNEYVASSGYFAQSDKMPSNDYNFTGRDALEKAFENTTGEPIYLSSLSREAEISQFSKVNEQTFSDNFLLDESSRVKKVFYPMNEALIPAFYVEVTTSPIGSRKSEMFSYVIDGESGKILFKNNLTAHADITYKIFADTSGKNFPYDGPQGNGLTPHPTGNINDTPMVGSTIVTPNIITLNSGPISTDDPWLTDTQNKTSGNNVDAYADISGENGFDADDVRPDMSGANAFEFEFGAFSDGLIAGSNGQKFAIVNLFYVNNFLHDWFYDNGFDEISGNAQQNNFDRGGIGADRLLVEAQDISDTNNANMSTPSDGGKPRMQMFIWDFLNESGMTLSGVPNIGTGIAQFGLQEFNVTGVISLVDDGTDTVGDGCETITTDLTGLIGVIDRGDCNFTVKVKNAQIAGALGVIMVNNVATEVGTTGLINMSGDDTSITIPSIFVNLEDGTAIKNELTGNPSLEANIFNIAKPIDGTLDNAIVAHEWAHYMSNRLIGNANGLINSQGRGMGEGWSDFVALLMTVRESDNLVTGNDEYKGIYAASTFVGNAYYGIRRVPVSADMTKNALTFKHIENGVPLPTSHPVAGGASGANNSEVHNTGEIWAVTLWDIFVGLVNKPEYSFEEAREVMKDYLVAGMKMTPIAPTLLEARDALLSAALANNVDDFNILRSAFTRRGMGASAIAPKRSSESNEGVVEDMLAGGDLRAIMSIDYSTIDNGSCDVDGVLDTSETATVNITLKNFSSGTLPAFNVSLSSSNDISFSNNTVLVDSLAAFGDTITKSFEITLNSAVFMENIEIKAQVDQIGNLADDYIEPAEISTEITGQFDFELASSADDMSSADASEFDWTVEADTDLSTFKVDNGRWIGEDNGLPGSSALITPEIKVGSTGVFSISFDHVFSFEESDSNDVTQYWDGGVIEVSVDGGEWTDVIDYGATLSDPYTGTIEDFNGVIGGREAYTGSSPFMQNNILSFADGLVNGHNLRIRFLIGTDANTGEDGWEIDNVVVSNALEDMFSDVVTENNVCLSGNAPVVDAGTDVVARSTDSANIIVELSGTATDADGDTLTVNWAQRSGTAVTITNANSLNTSVSIPPPSSDSTYVFELSANDGSNSSTDSVSVVVDVNDAPTVSASGGMVSEGDTATLTATAEDADGDALTYSWTQTSGESVTLSGADTATATFTAPQVTSATTFTFEVVVNDGFVSSAAASTTVTVNNKVVTTPPPASSGGGGGSIPLPLLILLALYGVTLRRK